MILGRYTNHLEIVMQERIENPHHDCHGDVVVGAIDIGVPKAVAYIEVLTAVG